MKYPEFKDALNDSSCHLPIIKEIERDLEKNASHRRIEMGVAFAGGALIAWMFWCTFQYFEKHPEQIELSTILAFQAAIGFGFIMGGAIKGFLESCFDVIAFDRRRQKDRLLVSYYYAYHQKEGNVNGVG